MVKRRQVFKTAIREVPDLVLQTIQESNLGPNEIKIVISHQASRPMIDAVMQGLPNLNILKDMEDGNFSSGSIPKALKKALQNQLIEPGDNLVLVGMGAGLFASVAVVKLGQS